MRSRLTLLIVIALSTQVAAAPETQAASKENLSDSGNAFVRTCSVIEDARPSVMGLGVAATCATFVMGITEGIAFESSYAKARGGTRPALPFCMADTYGVEAGQKVRILLKYIHDNPKEAHMPSAGLFAFAMGDAFPPCPSKE